MAYINIQNGRWEDGVHIGKYKHLKAFIDIKNDELVRIVTEDATHIFGDSMYMVDRKELFIYIDVPQDPKKLQEKDEIIQEQWQRINKYAAEEDENRRYRTLAENILKEKQQRHNAQLRSVFYMLEQVENIGTHREKAVIINYLRKCIYGFLKEDGLDKYGCPDDLPF